MIDKNAEGSNKHKTVGMEMKEAESILTDYIMKIEEDYDSIIADCVLVKVAFDRIADIKQQGELHYLNDILTAVGRRLEEINIPSMIAMETIPEE